MQGRTFAVASSTFGLEVEDRTASRARQALLFYVAVPVGLGLLFGWMKSSRTVDWPMAASLGYWVMITWTNWLLCDGVCRLVGRAKFARAMPFWLLLLGGALLARPVVYLMNRELVEGFQELFVDARLHRPLPDVQPFQVLKSTLPGLVLWTGIGLLLHRFTGFPHYGRPAVTPLPRQDAQRDAQFHPQPDAQFHPQPDAQRDAQFHPRPDAQPGSQPHVPIPAASASPESRSVPGAGSTAAAGAPTAPGFLARLPAKLGHAVWAVAAEEHYLRVHTDRGSALVLYRMSDAVRELAGWDGTQVHRSYWVARVAVQRVERTRGQPVLLLRNGLQVPVSRSFRRDAEQAGLLRAASDG